LLYHLSYVGETRAGYHSEWRDGKGFVNPDHALHSLHREVRTMTAATLKCPTCRREVSASPGNPHAPFCSARCRTLDLGRWLDGAYAVPVTDADQDEDGDASAGEGSEPEGRSP
jgi:uncharacterized protein